MSFCAGSTRGAQGTGFRIALLLGLLTASACAGGGSTPVSVDAASPPTTTPDARPNTAHADGPTTPTNPDPPTKTIDAAPAVADGRAAPSDAAGPKPSDTAAAGGLGPLPSPWTQKDFDNATLPGTGRYDRGVFVVQGAGVRAWEQDDDVHFAYLPLTGDGTIEARVVSVENTATYAFAGVMFRSGDGKAAPAAVLRWAMGQGIYWTVRPQQGSRWGEASPEYQRKVSFPYWMRLSRTGSTFHAFVSPDGKAWTELSPVTAKGLSETMYVGLAVNSQTNKALNTSVFDNVKITSAKSAVPIWEATPPTIPGETYVDKPNPANGPMCPPGADEGSGADCQRLCDCLQSRCAGTSDNTMRCKGDPANFCTGFTVAACLTSCKAFTPAQLCCRAGACVQTFHKGELCEQAFTGKGC